MRDGAGVVEGRRWDDFCRVEITPEDQVLKF